MLWLNFEGHCGLHFGCIWFKTYSTGFVVISEELGLLKWPTSKRGVVYHLRQPQELLPIGGFAF